MVWSGSIFAENTNVLTTIHYIFLKGIKVSNLFTKSGDMRLNIPMWKNHVAP